MTVTSRPSIGTSSAAAWGMSSSRRACFLTAPSSTTSPPSPSCWARAGKAARTRALELLERVGLPASLASRYPAQLSGGQQQRVGVARALAADPPVMLMDEPFSAVDPVVRAQLQDEFLRLQGELGKTIVFVTHDIDEAVKLGDRVAVLRVGGHLAQLATPRELLANPADSFVAGFVGRDRGYRALGFSAAGELPLARRRWWRSESRSDRWRRGRATAGCWSSTPSSGRRDGCRRARHRRPTDRNRDRRPSQPRGDARHRRVLAPRGPRCRPVVAERARRDRPGRRDLARHGNRIAGPHPDRAGTGGCGRWCQ